MTKFGAYVNGLAADDTPDGAADYVPVYDASAGGPKKVLLNNLPGAGGAGDVTWAVIQASQLVNEIKGWPPLVNSGDLDALNLWWDKVSTPTTAPSVVAVSGEAGITETFELCMKLVADGANEGLQQRWTYADEPRVKSGRKLSTIWAIWCVGGVGATLKLVNSDASETAAEKVTAAAWTIVVVEDHTLAGTYCDVRILTDGAGTIYAVPLGANIGTKAVPLGPRPLRYVDAMTGSVVNSADPGATWTDVDLTASTSNLACKAQIVVQYQNASNSNKNMCVRRNGDTTAAGLGNAIARSLTPADVLFDTGRGIVDTDDGQVIEYIGSDVAGDTEACYLSVVGYWEWA